jgi:trehalose 6-phosphate synthase
VATEGPLVNERDGALLLSPEAGAWAEVGEYATRVNPFDVSGTADALDRVLRQDRAERAPMAKLLRERASERVPADWLTDQLAAATTD